MANLLQLTNDSTFYKLINGALLASPAGYDNLEVFFREEFHENSFPNAKWMELFPAGEENESGEYIQVTGVNTRPVMAQYTSFDAEGQLIANDPFKVESKDMPRMRLAMNFNEKSFREGQKIMRLSGRPELNKVFNSFLKDSTDLIAGIHAQRSYTGLEIESTGKYKTTPENNAGGIQNLEFNFLLGQPKTNSRKAGYFGNPKAPKGKKKAWWLADGSLNPDANPIGDLQDIHWTHKNELTSPYPPIFRMSEYTYDAIAGHPSTVKAVSMWKTGYLAPEANLVNVFVSPEDLAAYLKHLRLPSISVENWNGIIQKLDPKTQERKKIPLGGFKDGVVLLRPKGIVGDLQWQSPTTLFATSINPMFIADGGRIGVQQETYSLRKAMHFVAESTGIPVPRNIDYFLYCDVATIQ